MSNSLKTMDGSALSRIPSEGPAFVVASLLSEGVHVLVGAPRTGKSWLMLWLCLCVANGDLFWNYECRRGTVLYLCLEDHYLRIQDRLHRLKKEVPSNIYFCNHALPLHNGFPEQLEGTFKEHPGTSLVVIDPLDSICGPASFTDGYQVLRPLRELAQRYHVAVLCVDRPRSTYASFSEMLSGDVDTMFLLERDNWSGNSGQLYCSGKDIRSRKLRLQLSGPVWKLCEGQKRISLSDPDSGR